MVWCKRFSLVSWNLLIETLTNHFVLSRVFNIKPSKINGEAKQEQFGCSAAVSLCSSCMGITVVLLGMGWDARESSSSRQEQMWALSPFPELSGTVLSCFTSLSASSAGLVSTRNLCFYFLMNKPPGSCAGASLGSSLPVLSLQKLCCAQSPGNNKKATS